LDTSLGIKFLRDTNILLVLFEERFQIQLAVALIASNRLIVIDLLRFVLMTGMLQAAIKLISRGKQLVAARLRLCAGSRL
jgi:hypothetical protein